MDWSGAVLPTLSRWFVLSAFIALFGALSFPPLVMRGGSVAALRAQIQPHARRWVSAWIAIAATASLLDALAQRTGWSFITLGARVILLGALWMCVRRSLTLPTLFFGGLLLLSQSFQGNAAREAAWALAVLADWVHLLFSAIWLGGVAFLAAVVLPQARQDAASLRPLGRTVEAFSPLAVMSVLAIGLTGIMQSASLIGSVEALAGTLHGRALLAKLGGSAVLIGFGAFHLLVISPRLNAWRAQAETLAQAAQRFSVSLIAEAATALFVIAAAAAMTILPAARDAFQP